VKLQPGDTLSAQLLRAVLNPPDGTPPSAVCRGPRAAPAVAGKLAGRWAAVPAKDSKIVLAIQDDWQHSPGDATGPGQAADEDHRRRSTHRPTASLSLADNGGTEMAALAGNVGLAGPPTTSPSRIVGAPPTDRG